MIRGSCLCGGVQFEMRQIPLIALCHCSICRKAGGSAFEAGAVVPVDDFRFVKGEDLLASYESSPDLTRRFCRVCGSRTPNLSPDGEFFFVPAGALEDDPGVRPSLHMFVGSKAPWWEIHDDLPQFEEWVPGYGPGGAK